jgi:aryl-phospho-beta-D-glucosidase BglC (GH1 family)/PKD repeat protein
MRARHGVLVAVVSLVVPAWFAAGAPPLDPQPVAAAAVLGPLHTTGADSVIYDASGRPVRLVGFNWTGTENGGRNDLLKTADQCGVTWRTPADRIGSSAFDFDNMYQVLHDWGYNVIRIPVSWNNLEPIAPVWSAATGAYQHTWNQTYLDDLRSMVTKARANGLMVILDMHQDYWSPALHHITNWNGTAGYCEGVGMPRWLEPTIDAKASTTQNVDFYGAMNRFYRNVRDPASTLTQASPWQLLYSAWDQLSYQFSAQSGFAAADAVIGADILNEPYISYVGGEPPAGQTVLQAAGIRLRTFYDALAPAITNHAPTWLLFFQDSTGGYNAANPAARETPTMTGKPTVPGNWVYSLHDYDFSYGTFSDGVTRHDDFGITLVNAALANATAWRVPLYLGEFTVFSLGVDARQLTDAAMAETNEFLAWAKANRVSWSFWAYANPYMPMTVIDVNTNQAIPVVQRSLATGLDQSTTNQPPVASFTAACNGLVCAFDGRSSSDPDGTVLGWSWAFGDGTTGTGSTVSHTFAAAGAFTVTLTVNDAAGATATRSAVVTVTAPPTSVLAADTFTRTLASGWGTADVGGVWSTTSGATRFAVNGGRGAIIMATAGTGPSIFIGGVSSASTDLQMIVSTDKVPTGSGLYVSAIGRRVSGAGDLRAQVRLLPDRRVAVSLLRVSTTGAQTVLRSETVVTGLTYAAGSDLRVRVQVTGVAPTTVRVKVWSASATEPTTWQAAATDATATMQSPGAVGVMSYLSGGATNAPIVTRIDDLRVTPAG